jgi:hypothetical protein
MPTSKEKLESTYHSGRIKKVRIFVYIAQAVLMIVMLIGLTSMTPDASFSPLYLPFVWFFLLVGIMLVMVNVEGFFFKLFSMKWAKSDSERYLSTQSYTRQSIAIIIAAVVIMSMSLILIPITGDNIDIEKSEMIESEYNYTFSSQDSFAMTGINKITLTSDDEIPLDVYIMKEEDFENQYYGRRLNLYPLQSESITEMEYESKEFIPHGDYVFYVNSHNRTGNITFGFEKSISRTLGLYFMVFPVIFMGMNAIWYVYLLPIKKRYEKTSIYE